MTTGVWGVRNKNQGEKLSIILGIDPGSQFTGYGVVEERAGDLRCLAHGVIEAGGTERTMPERLLTVGTGLAKLIERFKPASVSVEKIFFAKNADSAVKLGQARGVVLYESARFGLKVYEYNPTEVKSALVGSGRASKEQAQLIVRALLGIHVFDRFDASDALSLAIHHARLSETRSLMREREITT
jgi:crossover junction endodeoxyribonuclease RuvC